MLSSQIATFDLLKSVAHGSISSNYTLLGALTHSTRLICFTNNTDGDMFLAVTNGSTPASDGTADNLFVAASSFKLFDVSTNRNGYDSALYIPSGISVWVRYSTAPTKNSVYLESIYGVGE